MVCSLIRHRINVVFRPEVSMSVFANIRRYREIEMAEPVQLVGGWLSFNIWVSSKEDADSLMDAYEWAFRSICDLDQENGGPYI